MDSKKFSQPEIARLVCGYLHTSQFLETKQSLLQESPSDLKLREFAALVDQGILRTFDVDGLTLVDILQEYATIKNTLDALIQSESKGDEVCKTDGPLRKLKILSDHWQQKSKGKTVEKCSPTSSSTLNLTDSSIHQQASPKSRLSSPNTVVRRQPLQLHHSYQKSNETITSHPLHVPVNKNRYLHRYGSNSRTQNTVNRLQLVQDKKNDINIEDTAKEVQRMLTKPNVNSTPKINQVPVEAEPVFKSPSPVKQPGIQSSPLKSRKSQLKSKAPTKKSSQPAQVSMPILVEDELKINQKIKKVQDITQQNDEEGLKTVLGEPIAKAISSVSFDNVDNFMANPEFDNLLKILDEVTEMSKDEDEQPPPSNHSSSTCHLAIDDDSRPMSEVMEDINVETSFEASKTPQKEEVSLEDQQFQQQQKDKAIFQVVAEMNQEFDAKRRNSQSGTPQKPMLEEDPKAVQDGEIVTTVQVEQEQMTVNVQAEQLQPSEVVQAEQEQTTEVVQAEQEQPTDIVQEQAEDVQVEHEEPMEHAVEVVQPEQDPVLETVQVEQGSALLSNDFMKNLESNHDKVETIGFIEASAIYNEPPSTSKALTEPQVQKSPKNNLRRSSRTRKVPKMFDEKSALNKTQPKKSQAVSTKRIVKNPLRRMVPSLSTLVESDKRSLQLLKPIVDSQASVACYVQMIALSEMSTITSTDIEEAEASGMDLDQVTLGQFCQEQGLTSKTPLKEHLIEDSTEKAILSVQDQDLENEAILAAENASTPLLMLDESCQFKTPTKTLTKTPSKMMDSMLEQDLIKAARDAKNSDSLSLSDLFNTPKKVSNLLMSEESRDKALSRIFKTPVKDTQFVQEAAENLLKKTPLSKLLRNKKSPLPSPFLAMASPGTPAKDVSIASISFHQEDSLMVTPSVQSAINVETSIQTPSPRPEDKDEPLVTPPLDQSSSESPKFADLNGSLGPPRTPRGKIFSNDFVMNSPLKHLKHLCEAANDNAGGVNKKTTFVFLSPSKRVPKRVSLMAVDTRSPLRSSDFSNWEARHDVNNLDHYQTKVKDQPMTSTNSASVSSTSVSRKRKASAETTKKSKKAKIDINMELVPQLKGTTPRKSGTIEVQETANNAADVPNALGLVPSNTNAENKTPKGRKCRKAVQRNLLDEDGFVSPRKKVHTPPKTPKKTPAKTRPVSASKTGQVTPIKLKPSPGKSRFEITPTRASKRIANSPAKIASAFGKTILNSPSSKNSSNATVLKASLLSLSQSFTFYDQKPWDT